MYLTWLDSNSWLIEMADQRVLLDPWLVGSLVFGNLPWLFKGERPNPPQIPAPLDLILLSQGLEDHAHPPTLERLDRNIPVVASANGAKVARKLGYQQVTALNHGEKIQRGGLEIMAVPGSPMGPTLVENGYVLREMATDHRLYYEPHGYHSSELKKLGKVDVIITPMIDLVLPLLGPIIQGSQTAFDVATWLQPQVMLPTADGKEVEFQGLLISWLQTRGTVAELRTKLQSHQLPTEIVEPWPGERLELLTGAGLS